MPIFDFENLCESIEGLLFVSGRWCGKCAGQGGFRNSAESFPEGIPGWCSAVRMKGVKLALLKRAFAVLDYSGEFWKGHEFKGFDQKLLFPGASGAVMAAPPGEGLFPMQTFADELSGAFRAGAVRSSENDSVAEIEENDVGPFFAAEGRNEREFRLGCHDGGGTGLPDQIHISIGFGNKALGFILPADEEVVVCELAFSEISGAWTGRESRHHPGRRSRMCSVLCRILRLCPGWWSS